ncbi:hypothetical protein Bca4012_019905 [Brassica carinata]|uniref:Uncharacterized protein n=1 Tax=Brassica carinata TaxID=52824 RepID=A0A8X8BCZ9_BRACI|nr:hypothetical protein Bca52824_001685 [Brassica carinata]
MEEERDELDEEIVRRRTRVGERELRHMDLNGGAFLEHPTAGVVVRLVDEGNTECFRIRLSTLEGPFLFSSAETDNSIEATAEALSPQIIPHLS